MNQKQKSLLIIKAILIKAEKSKQSVSPEFIELTAYLKAKIDSCLDLANPDVLLSLEELAIFNQLTQEARRKGRII